MEPTLQESELAIWHYDPSNLVGGVQTLPIPIRTIVRLCGPACAYASFPLSTQGFSESARTSSSLFRSAAALQVVRLPKSRALGKRCSWHAKARFSMARANRTTHQLSGTRLTIKCWPGGNCSDSRSRLNPGQRRSLRNSAITPRTPFSPQMVPGDVIGGSMRRDVAIHWSLLTGIVMGRRWGC